MKTRMAIMALTACACPQVWAGTGVGSDGSDGALFVPTGTTLVVDLGLATPAPWGASSPVQGTGVYDWEKWAVVFKYTTITIEAGATVRFANHPKGAPVAWLAAGDITIDGEVILDGNAGQSAADQQYAAPGPGGFDGGVGKLNGILASGGFGPGGGGVSDGAGHSGNGGGVTGGDTYGSERIIPLIGGSGGGGQVSSTGLLGGGAGGGSILIATSGTIEIGSTGLVSANGGDGGAVSTFVGAGSGGAIRLVAAAILGSGRISALGSDVGDDGSDGRIRFEAPQIAFGNMVFPTPSVSFAQSPVFSDEAPVLMIESVTDGDAQTIPFPVDPDAGILTTDADVDDGNDVTVNISARRVPPGTVITVIVAPANADRIEFQSEPLVGTMQVSTTTAVVTMPQGRSEIQLRANWAP
jgi:hypothetical protein